MNYQKFLDTKQISDKESGFRVSLSKLNPMLFDWQKVVVRWALVRGRAALFEDCGLGKTPQQLEWANQIYRKEKEPILILAPLAVSEQTCREGKKFGIGVNICKSGKDIRGGINITNYEKLHKFNPDNFIGIVLDESSILKNFAGATRNEIIAAFGKTKYRLACTATPAPNDYMELGNHAEFLGVMSRSEMLATFFINDTKDTGTWRLKGHVKDNMFWKWLASWAVMMSKPSDIGFEDGGFLLPDIKYHQHIIPTKTKPKRGFLPENARTMNERRKVRKETVEIRCKAAAELINATDDRWAAWCNLNPESETLTKLIDDSLEVAGKHNDETKSKRMLDFAAGRLKRIVTKPKIAGLGMNWQICNKAAFIGLSDCYDEKTEILTKRGWLSFKDVLLNDLIATVNPKTLMLEYQTPTKKVWEKYSGEMIQFIGRNSFDLLVTPNHKLFVNRCKVRFPNDKTSWQLKHAKELQANFKKQEYKMLSTTKGYKGVSNQNIEIPLIKNQRISSRSKIVKKIPTEIFMQLVGWYLSEGYCRPINSNEAGRIVICQSDIKQLNRNKIIDIFHLLNLNINSKTKDITTYSINLAAFLINEFGTGADNKYIPEWIKNFDDYYLRILRDTMLKGGGCYYDGVANTYRTNSKQLADDFQEICLKTGIRASVKERNYGNRLGKDQFYDVQLAWKYVEPSIYQLPKTIDYNGMIGCVTVPNHIIVIRRNGIPIISGNSWEQFYQAVRRIWRFGQKKNVDIHIFIEEREGAVLKNIQRKDLQAKAMIKAMVKYMKEITKQELKHSKRTVVEYKPTKQMELPIWI